MMKTAMAAMTAMMVLGGTATASVPTGPGLVKAQGLVTAQGVVRHFTLTPMGWIAGLQLSDGTQVFAPPFMSTQIAYAVKLGDQVRVQGRKMGKVLRAVRIEDATSHQTVALPLGKMRQGRTVTQVQGQVASVIDGPHDRHFGLMLTNGTELALPPSAFAQAALVPLAKPGATLVAHGVERTSALGTVIKVQMIGATASAMTTVNWPHWRHGGHKAKRRAPASSAQ